MAKYEDIIGRRFGRLVVLGRSRIQSRWYADCLCDCGQQKSVYIYNVMSGKSKSCGCLAKESSSARFTTHGRSYCRGYDKAYRAWQSIKDRCYNPNSGVFHNYGGRGISVCARWMESFDAFLHDMGSPPTASHSIDRIHNDGNYEPGNCRWATSLEQGVNKRTVTMLKVNDEEMCVTHWARRLGMFQSTLRRRVQRCGMEETSRWIYSKLTEFAGRPANGG